MYRIAVLGDYDSIYGFATLGLDTFSGKYGVIYVTERWAAELKHEISRYQEQITPAIIQIPGIAGNTGAGVAGVKKSVEIAVGSDIVFSQQ